MEGHAQTLKLNFAQLLCFLASSISFTEVKITRHWKGGFPLSRNVYARNKIEVMYEVSRVNVKVERGSTLRFTRNL